MQSGQSGGFSTDGFMPTIASLIALKAERLPPSQLPSLTGTGAVWRHQHPLTARTAKFLHERYRVNLSVSVIP